MRSVVTFAALALGAAIMVPRYAAHTGGNRPVAMTTRPASAAVDPAMPNSRSVVVPRNRRGHFEVDGRIDGRRLSFMVDTGATVIALTERDAAALGIHPAQREFKAQIRTANGIAYAAPVDLDMVEIGNLMLRNVAAMVMPDGALSDNLLGLSFLSRLRRFEYSDGKMVLEQ